MLYITQKYAELSARHVYMHVCTLDPHEHQAVIAVYASRLRKFRTWMEMHKYSLRSKL